MPTYEFRCNKCDKNFQTVESIKTFDGDGHCPTCNKRSKEYIFTANVYFVGAKVESPEFSPALGQVVKNSKHRKEIAREKGLIEIGNEPTEKIHKKFDSDRADKLKKSWDDV